MIDNFKLDIHGMKEVENALLSLPAAVAGRALTGAIRDAGKPLLEDMQASAPVGTVAVKVKDVRSLNRRIGKGGEGVLVQPGQLKGRIKMRSQKAVGRNRVRAGAKKGEVVRVRIGVFRAYYANFVEFGTKHQPARPFLRPAINKWRYIIPHTFENRIKHKIKLAEKRIARQNKAKQGRK